MSDLPSGRGRTGGGVGRVLVGHGELAAGQVDPDHRAVPDVAGEQGAADAGLDLAGDEPAQRPGAEDGVVALPGDVALGVRSAGAGP